MYAGYGGNLLADISLFRPSVCEECNEAGHSVAVRNLEEFVHVAEKGFSFSLPDLVVEEDSQTVEAQLFSPSKFPVYDLRVPGAALPHLDLISGVGRYIVAAHRPFH